MSRIPIVRLGAAVAVALAVFLFHGLIASRRVAPAAGPAMKAEVPAVSRPEHRPKDSVAACVWSPGRAGVVPAAGVAPCAASKP